MLTPLQVWPRTRHRGRPGYSGRHFDAVSPQIDTPLSVALTMLIRLTPND